MMRTYEDKPVEQKEPIRKEIEELTKEYLRNGGKIKKSEIIIRDKESSLRCQSTSQYSINQKAAQKLNESRAALKEHKMKRAFELYNEGVELKYIAEEILVSISTAQEYIRRMLCQVKK